MTADLNRNILNLKPSVPPSPQNEPYKLTFFIEDETKSSHSETTDLPEPLDNSNAFTNYYDDVVVESYENSEFENDRVAELASNVQHNSCIVSAFLYFITISTFAYLVILWIKQKMHMQMELMHWW